MQSHIKKRGLHKEIIVVCYNLLSSAIYTALVSLPGAIPTSFSIQHSAEEAEAEKAEEAEEAEAEAEAEAEEEEEGQFL